MSSNTNFKDTAFPLSILFEAGLFVTGLTLLVALLSLI